MCRYKLATYWQNFTEIYLTWVKILQKALGATFLSHTVENGEDNELLCVCDGR